MFKREKKQPIEEIEDEVMEDDTVPTPEPVAEKAKIGETPNKILVVKELPNQPVRKIKDEDGTVLDLMTIEEALTELMNQ